MIMTATQVALHNVEFAAGNLLSHLQSCTCCYAAFARSGGLGAGCANGKRLRSTWCEEVAELQDAEYAVFIASRTNHGD